jgi:hypothetical protein
LSLRQTRGQWRYWIWLKNVGWAKLKSVFKIIYWNQQRGTTTEQGKLKLIACFTKKKLRMSLKISWEKQTLKIFLPSWTSSQQVSKNRHNSFSRCCCSLFVTVSVWREPVASFSHLKLFNQNQISQFLQGATEWIPR